uniref:Envelope glycoprotein L n=1 Tax=Panagrellus redivivus TaxID=6233 RepID=A0A7E4VR28_PANRE
MARYLLLCVFMMFIHCVGDKIVESRCLFKYHPYSIPTFETNYDVSLGLLINKNVDTSCPEQTDRYNRQYYVITSASRASNFDFNDLFFNFLHESIINNDAGPAMDSFAKGLSK